jgi:hypothetical protein
VENMCHAIQGFTESRSVPEYSDVAKFLRDSVHRFCDASESVSQIISACDSQQGPKIISWTGIYNISNMSAQCTVHSVPVCRVCGCCYSYRQHSPSSVYLGLCAR